MRRPLALLFAAALAWAPAAWAADVQIVLTSGTSWTVPDDFNQSENTVEVIAGGGGGSYTNQRAGGGGAYSKALNLNLVPRASISYSIGVGGSGGGGSGTSGGDTWFQSTSVVLAKGGTNNGTGGQASSGVGDVKYSGGTGSSGGGGGGAAGPNGDGGNAVSGTGGTGDAGFGGVGGTGSGDGGDGTEWGSWGSGGGGGGSTTGNTGAGGLYGGGGGYSKCAGVSCGADNGRPGIIVITYEPKRRTSSGVF